MEAWLQTLPEELRHDENRVRVMVKSGELKPPMPPKVHDLTQFLVPEWTPSPEQRASVGGATSFSVYDRKRGILLHAGRNANAAVSVRNGLAKASEVLPASTWLAPSSKQAVLVFGGENVDGVTTFAAQHTVWTADGLTPAWLSAPGALKGKTQFADYVEQGKAGSSVLRRTRGPNEAFAVGAPAAVVFVSNKKGAAPFSRLSAEQLGAAASQAGLTAGQAEALAAKVAAAKIPVVTASAGALTADAVTKQFWKQFA